MSARKVNPFKSVCAAICLFIGVQAAQAQSALPVADIVFDTADSLSGWSTGGGNSRTLDTQVKVIGTASLRSSGTGRDRFRKVFSTPVNVSQYRYLTFWYYVDRPDLMATNGDFGQVEITSSGTFDRQEWSWSVYALHLQRGWNYVVLDLPGRNTGDTVPLNPGSVNYFRIYHVPRGSITTHIDNIVFTNREPRSFAFADFLEQRRIAASPNAVAQEDDILAFLDSTNAGGAERARACRRMKIDVTQREINAETLGGMGLNFLNLRAETTERRWIRDVMCGTRAFPDRATLISRLQALAAADIAVIGELATLFELTMDAAAQTKRRLLDVDLQRIMTFCGSTPGEIDAYIATGTVPGSMRGPNVLVRQCTATNLQIGGMLAGQAPVVSDRRATYKQCMSVFEQQGAQCANAYANADEDFDRRLKSANLSQASQDDAKREIRTWLDNVGSITVEDAREATGETTHGNPSHPQAQELEQLHRQFDQLGGQIQYVEESIKFTDGYAKAPDGTFLLQDAHTVRQSAISGRMQAELTQLQDEQEEIVKRICFVDDTDPQCPSGTAHEVNGPPPQIQPNTEMRCASMNLGSMDAWFDRPTAASGLAGQINEGDRIDHCLCELFDRGYSSKLPGDAFTAVGNCPTPEERIAQKCLENPYDGIDGVRKECLHLMQPISTDRESLGARLCARINPGCNAAYMNDDGKCGCGTRLTNGSIRPPGSTLSLPNCDAVGGIPTIQGGCQPFNSGANSCTPGGKDFYLAKDPVNDLRIRSFMDKIPGQTFIVPRTGVTRIVTPGIQRSQLVDSTKLMVRALRLNPLDDGTGQVKVYCKNSTTLSAANRLIETIPLSSISTTNPTFMTINLDAAEVSACYRNNANSKVYFEFLSDTKANQPVAYFDILGEIGSIKPPCIQTPRPNSPTPGPRPLNSWPATWTFSDNVTIATKFNGVGPMPTPTTSPPPALPLPICLGSDGQIVPCR